MRDYDMKKYDSYCDYEDLNLSINRQKQKNAEEFAMPYERRTGTTYERNDFKDCFKGRTKAKRIRHVLNE